MWGNCSEMCGGTVVRCVMDYMCGGTVVRCVREL